MSFTEQRKRLVTPTSTVVLSTFEEEYLAVVLIDADTAVELLVDRIRKLNACFDSRNP